MRSFRDLPIKHKLTIITMLTSGVALLLACVVFVTYEQVSFRRTMPRELSTTAQMIGFNSAAALSFNDPGSAEQTLKALAAQPHIMAACIYDKDGKVFAIYRRSPATGTYSPPPVRDDSEEFTSDSLELFRKINLSGDQAGTIYLQLDLAEIHRRLRLYVLIAGGMILTIGLVAYSMAAQLQRVISEPVSQLAAAVVGVAAQKDYTIRAVKQGNDELGQLIDGFNEMLAQIQARDAGLRKANDTLEERVAGRTAELANSLSLLNATLNSTADGILAVQFSGEMVCFNNQFETMWGFPPGFLKNATDAELITFSAAQVRNAEQFVTRITAIHASPEIESFDVIELKDGRVFERYCKPQRVDGKSVGLVINFRDITGRMRAETDLEKAHRELVETSRMAGMAEVATGVLHNVGNVLNSVNVSATLVTEQIHQSKAASLPKVCALLRQHQSDLAGFLANDPKGRQVPGYLEMLAGQLTSEQNDMLAELDSLRKNIEHIKDIVSMQQNYARVAGVEEAVKLSELVEHALQMNNGAMVRHEVRIVRDYQADPVLTLEKHKVLQILVNLMRNAKYACDESGRSDKMVTVQLMTEAGLARIRVVDNGVGIPPENLTRIFAHGFTTRKDGHGFGLHSAALAAKELGGVLKVSSDGSGLGAAFTLELPITKESQPV